MPDTQSHGCAVPIPHKETMNCSSGDLKAWKLIQRGWQRKIERR